MKDVELQKINSKTKEVIPGVKFGIYKGYTNEDVPYGKIKSVCNFFCKLAFYG
nr:hypothetical protein [uncultured Peptostreptococcus sp.]